MCIETIVIPQLNIFKPCLKGKLLNVNVKLPQFLFDPHCTCFAVTFFPYAVFCNEDT